MLLENIKQALISIRANKMRTFLTMLGIIIGISSVITIVGLGNGLKNSLNKELSSIGSGRIVFMMNFREDNYSSQDFFNLEDIEAIKRNFSKDLIYIQPAINANGKITSTLNNNKSYNAKIYSTVPTYQEGANIDVVKGRFINDSDERSARNTVVIEEQLAKDIFGTTDVLEKNIEVISQNKSVTYVIVGIYKKPSSATGLQFGSSYSEIYVPSKFFSSNYNASDDFTVIDAALKVGINAKEKTNEIKGLIERRHSNVGLDRYMTQTMEEQIGIINTVLSTLTLGLGVIAAISLLVGGIGVMNIMLVSVTERTREIGIRKALGAKYSEIMLQFLMESVIISFIGGIIGILIGIGFSMLIGNFVNALKNPYPDTSAIIFASVFSSLVGIAFGILPARKAAKLNPIDALRYE